MTGAALASAAAIVAAAPAYLPTHDIALGASTPLPLSTAKYELTAITDITIQGINDAYWFGWGGYIQADNTYYPGVSDVYVSGASGVLYYLVDNAAETFLPGFDLDNYFFEVGFPSIPYVGAGELFGTSSPIFQAAQATFYYGIPNVINSIVSSAAQLVPTFDLGPVKLGGGILASLFFYGQTPDYNPTTGAGFSYSTNGLSAILAYVATSISDNLPGAPSGAALAGAVSAAATTIQNDIKGLETAVKSAAGLSTTASSAAAKSPAKSTVAAEVKTETETEPTGTTTETETTGSTTEAGTSTDTTSTDTTSSTDTTTSTDDSATTPAKSTGTVAPKAPTSSTKPTTKPAKPQNPLAKIGKRISDALSGGKKTKSESSSSSDSSSSSSSGSSSSSSGSSGSSK
ncbi:hypothetical protein [Mycolicibacterium rhodesiae]|uniref:Uncharacterized protein n=1 Tax=Mycolicibacterium rhodesiae TaxID=36814 RepID=A0A1X0IX44_MYCRH|nr:hypothetical protein [Mycolicibacterium rhodesiae]MCV7346470.1 hypothetical protein [Mycolicibacterium rhodesiae]ORB53720.1 hypothetical protein BST42_09855 [Mycolicibacterium rhodesiae]